DNEAVAPAGNRAANVEQVVLRIDFGHAQVLHRHLIAAHPPTHAHPFDHARGEGRGADGAGRAVKHRSVRGPSALEVMALDHALEALALGLADHIDAVAGLENVDLHFVSDIRIAV